MIDLRSMFLEEKKESVAHTLLKELGGLKACKFG
jgi:hypothetical protein